MNSFQESLTIRWVTVTTTEEFIEGCNARRDAGKSKQTQGRNETCNCGSGLKFKKCCSKKDGNQ